MLSVGRLILREFQIFWISYVITAIFFAAYGFLILIILEDALVNDRAASLITDGAFLLTGQILGLGMTKFNLLNMYRTDPYTRKMRVLRKLPVRTIHIAVARMFAMVVLAAVNTMAYLLPSYMIIPGIQDLFTWTQLYHLIWVIFLFAIVTGSIYVYVETGFSGKRYFEFSLLFIALTFVAIYLLWHFDIRLTVSLLEYGREGTHLKLIATLLSGLVVYSFIHLVKKRLERRDYYS